MTVQAPESSPVTHGGPGARVSVVVVTRNRRASLLRTLGHLTAEDHPVVVVDNASTDGTSAAVRDAFPHVELVRADRNLGTAGRNLGVHRAGTPYVAFSDDDSWWAPGALGRAAAAFDAHPRLAVVAARIEVGPQRRLDPTCRRMAASPLPAEADLPGPAVLGFVACGAVVRRHAYLAAGGFSELIFFYGEETLLAIDLASAGWGLAYLDDVVAYHHPERRADGDDRARRGVRNELLCAWMRRPVGSALRAGARTLSSVPARAAAGGLADALAVLPAALRRRRRVQDEVERRLRLLEAADR